DYYCAIWHSSTWIF
nr:immunoglobulin light chain junction region [Macaca mulatta]